MLEANMKTQLKAYLEKLTKPVELIATLDDSAKSAEIKELLAEIAELSEKVTFKEDNTLAVRKPSFLITNPGSTQGPRFAGSPLGHEFTSLVLALLWTGGHPSKEAQALLEQICDLDGDFEFETYYSLTCHNCPDVVQALNLMAVLNPRIKHTPSCSSGSRRWVRKNGPLNWIFISSSNCASLVCAKATLMPIPALFNK